ncbi:MAG: hypothetical protein K9M10_00780 [Candidatus Pacebacteria bacterium]|nr:hypothetical protein [Candidatus Paceibacterota bacterium]MCF7856997.1 hypothetical protein [Candidatus Paceibacterota bacterium]
MVVKTIRAIVALLTVAMFAGCAQMGGGGGAGSSEGPSAAAVVAAQQVALQEQARAQATIAPSPLVQKTSITEPAAARLPLARKGEISSTKVLAKNIREALAKDPSGNKRLVKGTNTTAAGFLASVQAAGGTVNGLEALPVYLESLMARDMPSGKLTMSRVLYSAGKGVEKYQLDIKNGFTRLAHKGEKGWYDANTGRLILAGDCSNSPLRFTEGPVATVPVQQAQATQPALQCGDGKKYFVVRILQKEAMEVAGVRGAVAVERAKRQYHDGASLSGTFAAEFKAMLDAGELSRSTKPHKVSVNLLKPDGGVVEVLPFGAVVGEYRNELPKEFRGQDQMQVVFPESIKLLHYPFKDMREMRSSFVNCVNVFYAIEK